MFVLKTQPSFCKHPGSRITRDFLETHLPYYRKVTYTSLAVIKTVRNHDLDRIKIDFAKNEWPIARAKIPKRVILSPEIVHPRQSVGLNGLGISEGKG